MKKLLLLPMLVLVCFIACQKVEDTTTETAATTQTNKDATPTGIITTPPAGVIADDRSANEVKVCHHSVEDNSWHVIEINANAWPAHQAHGDAQLVDGDGDGWVAAENECVPGGDCDDGDGSIHPGAEEVCGDNIDNNCDGQIDEDCCSTNGLLTVTLPNGGGTLYVSPTDNSAETSFGGIGTDIPGVTNNANFNDALDDFNGEANTAAIVATLGDGNYAAKICADLVYNGCDDWYLPAEGELMAMYEQLGQGGNNNFSMNSFYWSSTEYSDIWGWAMYFVTIPPPGVGAGGKQDIHRCRCVRKD